MSVVYGQGDVFYRNKGRHRIGYTMLEVDGFPEGVGAAGERDGRGVGAVRLQPRRVPRLGARSSPSTSCRSASNVDYFHPGIRGVRNPAGDFVFLANFEWVRAQGARTCS